MIFWFSPMCLLSEFVCVCVLFISHRLHIFFMAKSPCDALAFRLYWSNPVRIPSFHRFDSPRTELIEFIWWMKISDRRCFCYCYSICCLCTRIFIHIHIHIHIHKIHIPCDPVLSKSSRAKHDEPLESS